MTTKTAKQRGILHHPLHLVYCVLFLAFWVYTGLTTPDLENWMLENTLTLSLIIILAAFYNIFRFSDLSYTLTFLFLLLHVYGSQYQYSDNPFGEWLKEQYSLQRNPYDRLVHLGFGLLLAYPMHDVLLRALKVRGFFSYLMPVEIVLSLGAIYEVVEWMVADIFYEGDQQGMDFLGMQGDIWDAQKDIALAFVGGAVAMVTAALLRRKREV